MDVRQIALDTLKSGAPGLSDATREGLAGIIARKVALSSSPSQEQAPAAPATEPGGERERIARLIWERFAPSSDVDDTNAMRGEYILAADAILAALPNQKPVEGGAVAQWQRRNKFPSQPGATGSWENCSEREATGHFERSPSHEYRALGILDAHPSGLAGAVDDVRRLKLAICGGEDVPGAIEVVTVEDCERFIREERANRYYPPDEAGAVEVARKALEPFARYIENRPKWLDDDHQISQGSPLARNQLKVRDCVRAAEALAALAPTDGEGV